MKKAQAATRKELIKRMDARIQALTSRVQKYHEQFDDEPRLVAARRELSQLKVDRIAMRLEASSEQTWPRAIGPVHPTPPSPLNNPKQARRNDTNSVNGFARGTDW